MLGLLYAFLLVVIVVAGRGLRPASTDRRRIADFEIVDPARSNLQVRDRLRLASGSVIGRDPSATARIDDASVSARHATLLFEDGGWWIEDLDSRNGTFVDEARVSGRAPLRNGATVQLGRVVGLFRA